MNAATDNGAIEDVMEIIIGHGFGGMDQAMSILLNEAIKIERAKALQSGAYERNPERTGYANGYKPKNVKSRLGDLELQIPQVLGGVKFLTLYHLATGPTMALSDGRSMIVYGKDEGLAFAQLNGWFHPEGGQ